MEAVALPTTNSGSEGISLSAVAHNRLAFSHYFAPM